MGRSGVMTQSSSPQLKCDSAGRSAMPSISRWHCQGTFILGFQSVATSATPASSLGRALTLPEDKGCRSRLVVRRAWGYGAERAPVLCFSSNKNRNNNKCKYSMKKRCEERAITKKKKKMLLGTELGVIFIFIFIWVFNFTMVTVTCII